MNRLLTFIAIAVASSFTASATAQCIGCSQGVTPSFAQQPVYSTGQTYAAPSYATASYATPAYAMPAQTCCYSAPMTYARRVYRQPVYSRACCGQSAYYSTYAQPAYAQPMYSTASYSMGGTIVSAPSSGCVGCCNGCGVVSQPVFNGGTVMENTADVVVEGQPGVAVPAIAPTPEADDSIPPVPTPDDDGT